MDNSHLSGPQLTLRWEKYQYWDIIDLPNGLSSAGGGPRSPNDILPVDLTLGIGVLAQYKSFSLRVLYDQGVINGITESFGYKVMNHKPYPDSFYSRELTVSLGYKFY